MALALRSSAAARYASNDYAGAVGDYSAALALFEQLGAEIEIGKTLNSALHSLAYIGQNQRALEWAERARDIFARHGDHLRLARLATNMANILFRQDRFAEALKMYEEALVAFRRSGSPQDIAAALSNLAVCRTSVGEFTAALEAYAEARAHSAAHDLTKLVAEADYNIAWLHYLRGDYMRAMKIYAQTRILCRQAGDLYHLALCDLDESEMYLELNLSAEGGELARRAAEAFASLGMNYERAKALLNQAAAETRPSGSALVEALLREARALFVAQDNRVWPAMVDLHAAMVARRLGETTRARRLARRARRVLASASLAGKATLCAILEAQLLADRGEIPRAGEIVRSVLNRLERSEMPAQRIQATALLAEIEDAGGRKEEAVRLLETARDEIESLRSRVWGESSRISFLKDKLRVYEWLAHHYLRRGDQERAFAVIQQVKSRSMTEMLASPGAFPADAELDELLKDLNGDYRQLELVSLDPEAGSAERVDALRGRTRRREQAVLMRFTALGTDPLSIPAPLGAIQRILPAGSLLIEYYEIRGVFHVCLVDRQELRIVPLADAARVRSSMRFIQLQIARMRDAGEAHGFAPSSARAAVRHFAELYDALLAPIEPALAGRTHLIVAPHGLLHEVPFHALFDGERYLIDRFEISYTPSAGVLAQCVSRRAPQNSGSLVLGAPDEQAPWITEEARSVAECLPDSRLLIGADATEDALRVNAPRCRYLHIAAHGVLRRDNPLFSAIRLGGSRMSLLDLYRIPLEADLATLSGCSTGLSAITGGDELLGLIRGVLGAGARTVLASLWDVHDRSTTEFMTAFYRALMQSRTKTAALRTAIFAVRQQHPHPWYWAPFVLVGAPDSASS